jgi:hypothetical protein
MNIMEVKFKTVIAYEPVSSVTHRITPADLAELITKIPTSQLDSFSDSVLKNLVFTTDDRKRVLQEVFLSLAHALEA